MLTVTEAAGAHLAQIIEQQGMDEDVAVRFVYDGQGIALQQDSPNEGDTKFEHEDRTVLLLDPDLSQLLENAKLDVKDSQLTLEHPDAGA